MRSDRVLPVLVFLLMSTICSAQGNHSNATAHNAHPVKRKRFTPGTIVKQKLHIPVGKMVINGLITLEVTDDPESDYYNYYHTYRLLVKRVQIDDKSRRQLPKAVVEELGSSEDNIDLTAEEIRQTVFPYKMAKYWIRVEDNNMDGVPDLAFIADQGFHSNLVKKYIWVNIKGALCYWHSLSDITSEVIDIKQRTVQTVTFDKEAVIKRYKITKDTTLTLLPPE